MTPPWVKLNRTLTRWRLHPANCPRSFTPWEAYLDLVMLAEYQETLSGSIPLKRGQWLTTIRALAERWRVSHKTVEAWLRSMVSDKLITKDSTTRGTIVTICDFDCCGNGRSSGYHNEYRGDYDTLNYKEVRSKDRDNGNTEDEHGRKPWEDHEICF